MNPPGKAQSPSGRLIPRGADLHAHAASHISVLVCFHGLRATGVAEELCLKSNGVLGAGVAHSTGVAPEVLMQTQTSFV